MYSVCINNACSTVLPSEKCLVCWFGMQTFNGIQFKAKVNINSTAMMYLNPTESRPSILSTCLLNCIRKKVAAENKREMRIQWKALNPVSSMLEINLWKTAIVADCNYGINRAFFRLVCSCVVLMYAKMCFHSAIHFDRLCWSVQYKCMRVLY